MAKCSLVSPTLAEEAAPQIAGVKALVFSIRRGNLDRAHSHTGMSTEPVKKMAKRFNL